MKNGSRRKRNKDPFNPYNPKYFKRYHTCTKNILSVLKKNNQGIKLDIGCGFNKQKGFVGMDIRAVQGVDIVHDVEQTPYPLPGECCSVILASHLLEHICPKKFILVMDEWWRILKDGGQAWISMPYGTSQGFHQDPTHCGSRNETCVTPDTEVLTYNGFKKIIDITEFDSVLSLNPQTNKSEFVEGCKLISYSHDGPMVHFKGRAIDLITNYNHNVWFATSKTKDRFRFAEAETFLKRNPQTTIFSSRIDVPDGEYPSEFFIPEIKFTSDKVHRVNSQSRFNMIQFAEFLGWYLSEGCVYIKKDKPSYYIVQIAQRNSEYREQIANVITRLGLNPHYGKDYIRFSAFTLAQWLTRFGHCRDKYIPRDILNGSTSVLKRIFDSLMKGDGHRLNESQCQYTTLSRQLADDVQELALKLGKRASIVKNGLTKDGSIIYRVHMSDYSPIYANSFVSEYYFGSVHSLQMPKNHIYLARRNKKCIWTGNTWEYFNPYHPLYQVYRPKPWKITRNAFYSNGNMEVIMEKMREEDVKR